MVCDGEEVHLSRGLGKVECGSSLSVEVHISFSKLQT